MVRGVTEPSRTRREGVDRWGYLRTGYRAIMTRLSRWLVLTVVMIRKFADAPSQTESLPADVRVAEAAELYEAADNQPELGLTKTFIAEAIARGDLCVGAFVDGRLVAYVWRSYTGAPHRDGLWLDFHKPYRYGYKSFTLPEFRGQHLLDLAVADPICSARGFEYGISFIETHNYASIRHSKRAGAIPIGYAGYLKLGKYAWPFRTRGAKRVGFAFYRRDEASPELDEATG